MSEAFALGLKWTIGIDSISEAEKKAKWEADEAEKAESRNKASAASEEKKRKAAELRSQRAAERLKLQAEGLTPSQIHVKLAEWDAAHGVVG